MRTIGNSKKPLILLTVACHMEEMKISREKSNDLVSERAIPANNERVAGNTRAMLKSRSASVAARLLIVSDTFAGFQRAASRCFGRLIDFRYSKRRRPYRLASRVIDCDAAHSRAATFSPRRRQEERERDGTSLARAHEQCRENAAWRICTQLQPRALPDQLTARRYAFHLSLYF